jgi:hypothetical protein
MTSSTLKTGRRVHFSHTLSGTAAGREQVAGLGELLLAIAAVDVKLGPPEGCLILGDGQGGLADIEEHVGPFLNNDPRQS